MTRKPSCLISCSQASPEAGCGALLGRQGGTKPRGRGMARLLEPPRQEVSNEGLVYAAPNLRQPTDHFAQSSTERLLARRDEHVSVAPTCCARCERK
jgi:hypothetical protein